MSLFLIFCDRCKLFSFTRTHYTQVPLICQVISFTDSKNISLFLFIFVKKRKPYQVIYKKVQIGKGGWHFGKIILLGQHHNRYLEQFFIENLSEHYCLTAFSEDGIFSMGQGKNLMLFSRRHFPIAVLTTVSVF